MQRCGWKSGGQGDSMCKALWQDALWLILGAIRKPMWLQHRENGDQREGNEMRLETELGVRLCRWDLIGLGSLL